MWWSVMGCLVTLTLRLLAAPLATVAQSLAKVPRVGYLSDDSGSLGGTAFAPLAQELRALGSLEGRHIVFEPRYAEGTTDALPGLAAALVHRQVDVLVASGTPAAQAAQHATRRFPLWPSWGSRWRGGWWPAWRGPAGTSRG